ncbi:MAG: Asp-tRNA(Asn)/Glu-tRNA(Gln) amidotransferase subunit GatB, partial [Saprospiraceae bacterium]|nr:Asp-tRNA(Asn)/Glu-tRNA(Gln) amidotransferase subunit GatB [Saprospiraceae bacterium]
MTSYETVIGLEVHVQLNTQSKAFCGDANVFGGNPNTRVNVVSLAHPGTLPRSNRSQIEKAAKLGLAINGQISQMNTFDRKNYFYADLPKGYQITQDQSPIIRGGMVDVRVGQRWKSFRIHHVHMEEDAGKSIHTEDPTNSFIDLNRAGVPLLEIVTEPDFRSAEEVDAFMTAMRQLVRYLDISDGNMEEGSLRCDINISLRPKGTTELRARCEIKNVNSMRYARQAIAYEVGRQQRIYDKGGKVSQQTLHFDPVTGVTSPLREKENAHDYRYFAEPDLPPVVLSTAWLETLRNALPRLPKVWFEWLTDDHGLSDYDATLLTNEDRAVKLFAAILDHYDQPKSIANLIINRLFSFCQEKQIEMENLEVTPQQLASFVKLIDEGTVSNSIAYQRVFPAWLATPDRSPREVAESLNVVQDSDEDALTVLAK